MNPNSDPEIKKFLYTLGWTPDEFNVKKLEGGGFKRTSPKLSESSFGSLPPGLGQTIKTYRTLKHRRGLIQSAKNPETAGALSKVREDGRVQAEAITCGTPTARYTHSGAVCNIPRPSSPYGGEVRKLYCVPEGHWMVGVDLSGIEARMLAHGCYPFPGGPEFARLVTTKEDGGWHQANAGLWSCTRDDAKTELYALMFNAGGQKLGNILGRSAEEGLKNKRDFMLAYPPYAMLVAQLEAEYEKNDGWIQGIDGRRLYVRAKKDCLNTFTQGNSAILFKEWCLRLKVLREESPVRIEQIISYHDECQNEVYSEDKSIADAFGKRCEELATEVGRYFNILVEINAEAKTGMNWAECH
jgi:DNA polymerase I-like protein with 3'-5' exonuclease and polymerase domains